MELLYLILGKKCIKRIVKKNKCLMSLNILIQTYTHTPLGIMGISLSIHRRRKQSLNQRLYLEEASFNC